MRENEAEEVDEEDELGEGEGPGADVVDDGPLHPGDHEVRALPHHLLLDTSEPRQHVRICLELDLLRFRFVRPPIEDDGPVAAVHVEEGRVDHGAPHGKPLDMGTKTDKFNK